MQIDFIRISSFIKLIYHEIIDNLKTICRKASKLLESNNNCFRRIYYFVMIGPENLTRYLNLFSQGLTSKVLADIIKYDCFEDEKTSLL